MGLLEREQARQKADDFKYEVFTSSDQELNGLLKDEENKKLFTTSLIIAGITLTVSALTTELMSDEDFLKNVMLIPENAGVFISGVSLLFFASVRLKAKEILTEAKQRGINVIKGPHRQLDLPKE